MTHIPKELRDLSQWVNWDDTKAPINPHTNQRASSTDPTTWGTYEDATKNNPDRVGLVLTKDDPYVVIDYDQMPEANLVKWFGTYTEISQSGAGLHIVVKGAFDGRCRNDVAECYQSERYIIFTGNKHPESGTDIIGSNGKLKEWREYVGLEGAQTSTPPTTKIRQTTNTLSLTEQDVLDNIEASGKCARFKDLYAGNFTHASQSEADAELLEMLRFWSGGDKALCLQMFAKSGLYRTKWDREDYQERTWALVDHGDVWENGDRLPQVNPPGKVKVDISGIINGLNEEIETGGYIDHSMVNIDKERHLGADLGIINDLCKDFDRTNRQVNPEVGLFAALSLLGTLLGRRFITNGGNPTNLYVAIIGPSGCGKNHVKKFITWALKNLPGAMNFFGSNGWTSPGAIFSELNKHPNFISIIDELGEYIQNTKNSGSSIARAQFKTLKEAWNTDVLTPQGYSDHSKVKKSSAQKACYSPIINILGLATIRQWWESLDGNDCADGFLNRWLIYTTEKRPELSGHGFIDINSKTISPNVVKWWNVINQRSPILMFGDEALLDHTKFNAHTDPDWIRIGWAPGVEEMLTKASDAITDGHYGKPEWDMYQRVIEMACRISLIVTLAKNPEAVQVDMKSAVWAVDLVHVVFKQMFVYMKRNMAGSNEEKLSLQILDLIRKAHKSGVTIGQLYKNKLENGTRKNIKDALSRLMEGETVVTAVGPFRKNKGCHKDVAVYLSIEAGEALGLNQKENQDE